MVTDERDDGSCRARARVPKLCGADVELGNFVLGVYRQNGSGPEASRALLHEIAGVPNARSYWSAHGFPPQSSATYDPQDWGRKFLASNGGCAYIDLNHLEICLPEVRSAFDHVAAWHAMLRVARQALYAANERRPRGQRIQVLINNSDGRSNSYGAHLNFLVTRRAWDNIFRRRLHYQLFLASFQASSIVITGQGKVGAENGAPPVAFQLSQRADFLETLTGEQTTHHRPFVNSRDESLCGGGSDLARVHSIFYDSTLCHVASLLKIGLMQIVLAMIEAEQVDHRLILEDPVESVVRWSHDPTLQTQAPMVSGARVTAVELQRLFLEEARRFAGAGGCDGIVPRAGDILDLWEDTLSRLETNDFPVLVRRLDWVLKLSLLARALRQRPHLDWSSPEIKHLDHVYASLDPAEGLYWVHEAHGGVERLVGEERIVQLVNDPPEDTRAWTRAMLLRVAGADRVDAVDWDSITFSTTGVHGYRTYRQVELADPLAFTRAETERHFQDAGTLGEILAALGAQPAHDQQRTSRAVVAWPIVPAHGYVAWNGGNGH